ncbi:MAG TPA: hypothetical protein DCY03_07110 [Planctomycetaceae bacterium]|nr:hypothetical protein [Planctomycetaceae bacterium]
MNKKRTPERTETILTPVNQPRGRTLKSARFCFRRTGLLPRITRTLWQIFDAPMPGTVADFSISESGNRAGERDSHNHRQRQFVVAVMPRENAAKRLSENILRKYLKNVYSDISNSAKIGNLRVDMNILVHICFLTSLLLENE